MPLESVIHNYKIITTNLRPANTRIVQRGPTRIEFRITDNSVKLGLRIP